MITLPAAWAEAMNQSGTRPLWLVRLYLRHMATGADGNFYFCSGDKTLVGTDDTAQNSIHTITNFGAQLDPQTRALSVSDVSITFLDDGAIRELKTAYYMPGKKVEISIGTSDLAALSDFQKLGTFYIEDITPEEGTLTMRCVDGAKFWNGQEVSGGWIGWHPLEVVEQILQASGVDGSTYDHTSLHVSTLNRYQHFLVTRAHTTGPDLGGPVENNITSPVDAKGLVDELIGLTGGTFCPDQSGTYRFREYDPSPTVSATWTHDDIGSFTQKSTFANMINELEFINPNDSGINYKFTFKTEDTNSKNFLGVQGSPVIQNIKALEIKSPWLNGFGELWRSRASGMDAKVRWAHENGFCGTYVLDQAPLIGRSTQSSPSLTRLQGTGWVDDGVDFTITGLPSGHGITTQNFVSYEVGDISSPSNTHAWRSYVNAAIYSVAATSVAVRRWSGTAGSATQTVTLVNIGPHINTQANSPRDLTDDRLGYHMLITRPHTRHTRSYQTPEVVAVNSANYLFYDYSLNQLKDPRWNPSAATHAHAFSTNFNISGSVQFTYKTRGVGGTTTRTWPVHNETQVVGGSGASTIQYGAAVWDVTIQFEMFRRVVGRFTFGAPEIEITTNVTQYALEIGDFVKFTDDRFFGQGSAGLPTSADQVFEIVGKETRITDDTPSIKWDLVWFKDESVTPGLPWEITEAVDTQVYQTEDRPKNTYTIYDASGGVVFSTGGQEVHSVTEYFSPKEV